MLLWGEERGAVEVIAAGLGPSERLSSGSHRKREIRALSSTLLVSRLSVRVGLGLPHSLLGVSSPAGFNTEAAILNENL